MNIKDVIKEGTPPFLFRSAKILWESIRDMCFNDIEKSAAWYDQRFNASEYFREHYASAKYYFVWTVIADRIKKINECSILDMGCGSGRFALMLRDKGIKNYCGIDFSNKRIEWAMKVCPEFHFELCDVFNTNIWETYEYNTVTCTDFLDHLEQDIALFSRFPSGVRFLGTVSTFNAEAHVRHFETEQDVLKRYQSFFKHLTIDFFALNAQGKGIFLMDGITSA